MNERPTPETDAPRSGFSQTRELTSEEWFSLYEKTKRERDEARADRDIARFSDSAHDRLVGELAQALRERDEAQRSCQLAHDRLLRGDNDREILDILAKGWRAAK